MFFFDLLYNALAFINSLWPIDTIWQPNDMAPYGITELVINGSSNGLPPIQADNKEISMFLDTLKLNNDPHTLTDKNVLDW